MSTTFSSLPLETVQEIAGCIEKVHRPGLFTFSLTSKTFYNAAAFPIFRKISIMIHDHDGLRRDIDELVEALAARIPLVTFKASLLRGLYTLVAKRRPCMILTTVGLDDVALLGYWSKKNI